MDDFSRLCACVTMGKGNSFGRMLVLYAASFTSLLAGASLVHNIVRPDLVSNISISIFVMI